MSQTRDLAMPLILALGILCVLYIIYIQNSGPISRDHSFLGGFWTSDHDDTSITIYFSGDSDQSGRFILSDADGVGQEFEFEYKMRKQREPGQYSIEFKPIDNYSKFATMLRDDATQLEMHVDEGKIILFNDKESVAELIKDNKMMDMMLKCVMRDE